MFFSVVRVSVLVCCAHYISASRPPLRSVSLKMLTVAEGSATQASLANGAEVTLQRDKKQPDTFVLTPASACVSGPVNLCCFQEHLGVIFLQDERGVPVCGRFVEQMYDTGAGLGHWLTEYNALVVDELSRGVQRVLPPTSLGHKLQLSDIDAVLGITVGVRYSQETLAKAVQAGYLSNVTCTKADLEACLLKNNWAAIHRFTMRRSKPFAMSREFWRSRIAAQRLHFPWAHSTIFTPGHIAVCVHIRRGDVKITSSSNRYLPLSWYVKVLEALRSKVIPSGSQFSLVVLSEGRLSDFDELVKSFPDTVLLLKSEDVALHFVHMLYADILITSRSGFSSLAAELGDSSTLAVPFWGTYARAASTVYVDATSAAYDTQALRNMVLRNTM